MKKWLTILMLAAVAAGAGWYFGSPWWTLHRIKSAAEARDVKALNAYIDYRAVRADVRAQIKARTRPRGIDAPGDVADALASTIAQGVADAVVRPEGMVAVFAAGSVSRSPFAMRAEDMEVRYEGPNQFRLVNTGEKGGALVFRRYGLGWKIAGVTIPDGGLKLRL